MSKMDGDLTPQQLSKYTEHSLRRLAPLFPSFPLSFSLSSLRPSFFFLPFLFYMIFPFSFSSFLSFPFLFLLFSLFSFFFLSFPFPFPFLFSFLSFQYYPLPSLRTRRSTEKSPTFRERRLRISNCSGSSLIRVRARWVGSSPSRMPPRRTSPRRRSRSSTATPDRSCPKPSGSASASRSACRPRR